MICALIHQHRECLPYDFLEDWLSSVAEITLQCANLLKEAYSVDAVGQTVWVLRVAHVLAITWKAGSGMWPKCQDRWQKIEEAVILVCAALTKSHKSSLEGQSPARGGGERKELSYM